MLQYRHGLLKGDSRVDLAEGLKDGNSLSLMSIAGHGYRYYMSLFFFKREVEYLLSLKTYREMQERGWRRVSWRSSYFLLLQ